MIVVLDLETTGLNAKKHHILEVAAIVVTDDLQTEVATFHRVVSTRHHSSLLEFHELDEFIRDMHTKNGLWADTRRSIYHECRDGSTLLQQDGGTYELGEIDRELAEFIRLHAVTFDKNDKGETRINRPQLCGNSIHFDRSFMKRHLRNAEAELHYRMIDVSTINEVARRMWKTAYDGRPKQGLAHRAMPDARESLATLRYYSKALLDGTPTKTVELP